LIPNARAGRVRSAPGLQKEQAKGIGSVKTSRLLLVLTLALSASPLVAQLNDTYVITGAGYIQGEFNTQWMTHFSIFNPHLDHSLVVSITWLPTGGRKGIEELIEIPPNSLAYSDNIMWDLFGVQDFGSLLVATFPEDNPGVPNEVLSRSFLVNTNTYNNSIHGTFGQTVPGIWTGLMDYEYDGISAVAQGIRNSTISKWRTNVGAVNLGRCSVTLRVNVYDADGVTLLNQYSFIVPPLGHIQDRLPVQVENGTVEFFVEDPCYLDDDRYAVVFPYTSTVDQYSGDPRYQSPVLLASASILYAKGKTVEPHSLGKKIDSGYARTIRAQAERRGRAALRKTESGWQIAK
jgi:hypothetical protein